MSRRRSIQGLRSSSKEADTVVVCIKTVNLLFHRELITKDVQRELVSIALDTSHVLYSSLLLQVVCALESVQLSVEDLTSLSHEASLPTIASKLVDWLDNAHKLQQDATVPATSPEPQPSTPPPAVAAADDTKLSDPPASTRPATRHLQKPFAGRIRKRRLSIASVLQVQLAAADLLEVAGTNLSAVDTRAELGDLEVDDDEDSSESDDDDDEKEEKGADSHGPPLKRSDVFDSQLKAYFKSQHISTPEMAPRQLRLLSSPFAHKQTDDGSGSPRLLRSANSDSSGKKSRFAGGGPSLLRHRGRLSLAPVSKALGLFLPRATSDSSKNEHPSPNPSSGPALLAPPGSQPVHRPNQSTSSQQPPSTAPHASPSAVSDIGGRRGRKPLRVVVGHASSPAPLQRISIDSGVSSTSDSYMSSVSAPNTPLTVDDRTFGTEPSSDSPHTPMSPLSPVTPDTPSAVTVIAPGAAAEAVGDDDEQQRAKRDLDIEAMKLGLMASHASSASSAAASVSAASVSAAAPSVSASQPSSPVAHHAAHPILPQRASSRPPLMVHVPTSDEHKAAPLSPLRVADFGINDHLGDPISNPLYHSEHGVGAVTGPRAVHPGPPRRRSSRRRSILSLQDDNDDDDIDSPAHAKGLSSASGQAGAGKPVPPSPALVMEHGAQQGSHFTFDRQATKLGSTSNDRNEVIVAGSVNKLIEKLADIDYYDAHYRDVLLLTYRRIISTRELLRKVLRLFHYFETADALVMLRRQELLASTARQSAAATSLQLQRLNGKAMLTLKYRLRLFAVLKTWMKRYFFEDFYSKPKSLELLRGFLCEMSDMDMNAGDSDDEHNTNNTNSTDKTNGPSGSGPPRASPSIVHLPGSTGHTIQQVALSLHSAFVRCRRRAQRRKASTRVPTSLAEVVTSAGGDVDAFVALKHNVLRHKSKQIAEQLTLMDFQLFRAITPLELIGFGWLDKSRAKKARNVLAFVKRFNQVSQWASASVLTQSSDKKRCHALRKMIKIAYECYLLKNFHAVFAIVSGIQNQCVYRLKALRQKDGKTWNIGGKERAKMQTLEELFDAKNNFRHYRRLFAKCTMNGAVEPFCAMSTPLPHMGITLKDLTMLGMRPKVLDDGAVDFALCRALASTIGSFMACQRQGSVTPFHNRPKLSRALSAEIATAPTNPLLTKLSLKVQPIHHR